MRKIFSIFIVIYFCCCIREIPLKNTGNLEPVPVCHCFMQPDSLIQVSLSLTSSLSSVIQTINGAIIGMYKNGVFLGNCTMGSPGFYQLSATFSHRDSFKMIGTDGQHLFSSIGKIPSKLVLSSADTATELIPGIGPAFVVHFSFVDSAIDDNFYRVFVRKKQYNYILDNNDNVIDSVLVYTLIPIAGSELAFIQNNFNNYSNSEILFSDETFNGTKPLFSIYTTEKLVRTKFSRPVSLEFVLENVEKSLFQFYNTRNAHVWQQQSISQLPGQVIGNIEGGYGVVAAFTAVKKVILLK